MKSAVLFDLGNTLVHYFERHEFHAILKQAITEVQNHLSHRNFLKVSAEEMWRKVKEENYEASDHHVRPLEDRLIRIFQLDNSTRTSNLIINMCRYFMKPIFARGHYYEDTLPTLKELKARGFKIAIVSNTTWGSPANLWREEIQRLGLSSYIDSSTFCRDVGWRKPAKQIFEYTLAKMQIFPQNCVFVGDDPRWDIVGPEAVGIEPLLINRRNVVEQKEKPKSIENLLELIKKLEYL